VIYDLIVVGNGLAAQTFLFELFRYLKLDVKKSQNYSVAQVFSEDVTPSCSVRSTASVSLSGIAEGVSELGDDLRKSFYLFEGFVNQENPLGVEKVKQFITFSSEAEKEKLLRRYKNLDSIKSSLFKSEFLGVELDSYIVSPPLYRDWFNGKISLENIDRKIGFLKTLTSDAEGLLSCELNNGETLKAKKVVLCTGAYAKIFSQFYAATEEIQATQVVSGAYLQKKIDLPSPSFYLTIDGHNLIYRSMDQTLILGSASMKGAFLASDYAKLNEIFEIVCKLLNFSVGNFSEFKTVVGLRHKAPKRKSISRAINSDKSIYMINGFYKNGYSFGHLCAERVVKDIFLS